MKFQITLIACFLLCTMYSCQYFQSEVPGSDNDDPAAYENDTCEDYTIEVIVDKSHQSIVSSPTEISLDVLNRELNLTGRGYKKLPKKLAEATCIERIVMKNNNFSSIQDDLLANKMITKLDFENNKFTKFPEGDVAHITSLKLSGNNIKEIPASIAQFENLEYLYLSFNPNLTTISEEIKKCKNLKRLFVMSTPFSSYTKSRELIKMLPDVDVYTNKSKKRR